jgi:hypothetical protein
MQLLRSRPVRPHPKSPRTLAVATALGLSACTGPVLHLEIPAGQHLFVDGRAESRTELPFRYYGTTVLDALPGDVPAAPNARSRADFGHRPSRTLVALPPPAELWLFPFDFPVEVVHWLRHGHQATRAAVAAVPVPAAERVLSGVRPTGIEQVNERARAARSSR